MAPLPGAEEGAAPKAEQKLWLKISFSPLHNN